MSSVIQNLLDNVIGDGARASKFECSIHINRSSIIGDESEIFAQVKTSQFPGKSHEVIDLKYKGRSIPVKGQVKYDNTWSCTFYLTQDHKLKQAFEDWIESIDQVHNMEQNVGKRIGDAQKENSGDNNGVSYTTTMFIAQNNFDGDQPTAIYELHNVFPKSVSAVEVDYSSTGTILEFTVEFAYTHFTSKTRRAGDGSFVDDKIKTAQKAIDEAIEGVQKKASDILSDALNKRITLNRGSGEKPGIEKMATKHDWD